MNKSILGIVLFVLGFVGIISFILQRQPSVGFCNSLMQSMLAILRSPFCIMSARGSKCRLRLIPS